MLKGILRSSVRTGCQGPRSKIIQQVGWSQGRCTTRRFSASPIMPVWGQRKRNVVDKNFKIYKPVTPSLRHTRLVRNDELYKGRCHLPLTLPKRKTGGRNNTGRITSRHIGGGHKQRIRMVDFHRKLAGPQEVLRVEYDPGRSAHIALIKHLSSGALSYILAPQELRPGQVVQSFKYGIPRYLLHSSSPSILDDPSSSSGSEFGLAPNTSGRPIPSTPVGSRPLTSQIGDAPVSKGRDGGSVEPNKQLGAEELARKQRKIKEEEDLIDAKELSSLTLGLVRTLTIKPGNFLPIRLIPPGTTIHAISLKRDGKASLVRSAGTFAKVVSLGHHLRRRTEQPDPNPNLNRAETGPDPTDPTNLSTGTNVDPTPGSYAQIKLQSGEIRFVHMDAGAAIGAVSNPHWQGRKLGKAGRARWLGRRPRVRGVAMNKLSDTSLEGRNKMMVLARFRLPPGNREYGPNPTCQRHMLSLHFCGRSHTWCNITKLNSHSIIQASPQRLNTWSHSLPPSSLLSLSSLLVVDENEATPEATIQRISPSSSIASPAFSSRAKDARHATT